MIPPIESPCNTSYNIQHSRLASVLEKNIHCILYSVCFLVWPRREKDYLGDELVRINANLKILDPIGRSIFRYFRHHLVETQKVQIEV